MNRPTLMTIAKIMALRAGIVLVDHGDEVSLEDERMTFQDACAILGLILGTRCDPAVLKFGGVKIERH